MDPTSLDLQALREEVAALRREIDALRRMLHPEPRPTPYFPIRPATGCPTWGLPTLTADAAGAP